MAYHRRRVALFKYALPQHVAPLSSERRPITIIRAHHRHRITLYALPHHLDARNHILWVGLNLRGALRYVKEFALPEDEDKDETVLPLRATMLKVTHRVMNETVPHLSTTRDPGGPHGGICRNILRKR